VSYSAVSECVRGCCVVVSVCYKLWVFLEVLLECFFLRFFGSCVVVSRVWELLLLHLYYEVLYCEWVGWETISHATSACDWSDVWMTKNLEWHTLCVCTYMYTCIYVNMWKFLIIYTSLFISYTSLVYHLHIKNLEWHIHVCVYIYIYIYMSTYKYVKFHCHLHSARYQSTHLEFGVTNMCVCIYIYIHMSRCKYVKFHYHLHSTLYHLHIKNLEWHCVSVSGVWVECQCCSLFLSVVSGWVAVWLIDYQCVHMTYSLSLLYHQESGGDIVWVWVECEWSVSVAHSPYLLWVRGLLYDSLITNVYTWLPHHHFLIIKNQGWHCASLSGVWVLLILRIWCKWVGLVVSTYDSHHMHILLFLCMSPHSHNVTTPHSHNGGWTSICACDENHT